jgi:NAD(P)-dependent dehydrogenase (short-subunit alcohol dehydrogenase family)
MGGAAYASSKAAVLALTKNIGGRYVGTGIRCNAICPGACNTPLFTNTEAGTDSDMGDIFALTWT